MSQLLINFILWIRTNLLVNFIMLIGFKSINKRNEFMIVFLNNIELNFYVIIF